MGDVIRSFLSHHTKQSENTSPKMASLSVLESFNKVQNLFSPALETYHNSLSNRCLAEPHQNNKKKKKKLLNDLPAYC